MGEDGIIVIVMQEEQGWSAGSPQLGLDFVVLAPTQEAVMTKIKDLLGPLVAHGLRYRFIIDETAH